MTDTAVPLLDLKAQHAGIRDEIAEAMARVVESQHFVLGPEVQALEEEIAGYCESRHAVACASGSDAILLALMAQGVGPGDEVLCPTYTFFATAGAVARLGAKPVFADIDPDSFNVDASNLRRAAGGCSSLKALLPVHLYGQAAPMDEILELADELGVPVIEDAAQAIGSRDASGARAGSRGSIGCFSFFPSKNLGAYGDGGIVTTNDSELAERMRVLRVHGGKPKYFHAVIGLNSRLDSLQAAILRVKLRHLDAWSAARRANAARYDELFTKAGAGAGSGDLGDLPLPLRIPAMAGGASEHIFNQYVIRVPAAQRDALRKHLAEHEIGSEIYYPLPLHMQECFGELGYGAGDFPASERAAAETLAVPVYPELSEAQIETVVDRIGEFLRR